MLRKLSGKLNSKGLIKSLEVFYNGQIIANEIRLHVTSEDVNKFDTKESMSEWLGSLMEMEGLKLENVDFKIEPGVEGVSIIVLELITFENDDKDLFNEILASIISFMEPDKVVPTMSKVGTIVNHVGVDSDMLTTTLTINLPTDTYLKYVSGKEEDPELLLYSQENLKALLEGLLIGSNIDIPACNLVYESINENSITINYGFEPGIYDEAILEIFNYLTVTDFDDDGENAEDLFMGVNGDETVPEEFKVDTEFIPVRDDFKLLTDIFKSLKMDVDMEVDEMLIEQESLKTKISIRGLKFRSKMN